jgi:hypothetical protein
LGVAAPAAGVESAAGVSAFAGCSTGVEVGVVGVAGFGVQPIANSPRQTVIRLKVINFFMVEVSLNLVLGNETKN